MAQKPDSTLKKIQDQAQAFLAETDLVTQREDRRSRLQKFAHFWLLVGRSFLRNRCPVRAAAMAYTTLLALIPLLAVGISVTTSLLKTQEGEKQIEALTDRFVLSVVPQINLMTKTNLNRGNAGGVATDTAVEASGAVQGVDSREVTRRINQFIGNVRSGTLGMTGMVGLVAVAILLLSRIETTFNDIWGVSRGRSWFSRVVHYWAAITLGPLVLLVAIGITTGSQFETIQHGITRVPLVGKLALALIPFVLLSGAFALFYALMPNTRVQWPAALVGGAVGGTLWQLNNIFNVIYVSKVVTNSKIYGSLAIIPVFLIGLYFSWIILLLGAQVAYAFQNRRAYVEARQTELVNQREREYIALQVMTTIARQFQAAGKTPTLVELAEGLGVSTRLIGQVVQQLVHGRLLLEVAGTETGYAPARPLDQISCLDVLSALRAGSGLELSQREGPAGARVRDEFLRIEQAEREAAQQSTVQALINDSGRSAEDTRQKQ